MGSLLPSEGLNQQLLYWNCKVLADGPKLPCGSVVKNLPANARNTGMIPRSGPSPGGGNGNPLQYSCQRNPMDREAWWATFHGDTKDSDTTWQLNSNFWASQKSLDSTFNLIIIRTSSKKLNK